MNPGNEMIQKEGTHAENPTIEASGRSYPTGTETQDCEDIAYSSGGVAPLGNCQEISGCQRRKASICLCSGCGDKERTGRIEKMQDRRYESSAGLL